MTKEEARKRLLDWIQYATDPERVPFMDEPCSDEEIILAMRIGADALSLPSLPSNLDEAANKEADDLLAYMKIDGDKIYLPTAKTLMIALARFGAEWMAGQGVKLKCWIARDECSGDESNLYIGQKKPRRIPETAPGFGMWCNYGEFMALPHDMFPELTYSDEPIEVELIIRKK